MFLDGDGTGADGGEHTEAEDDFDDDDDEDIDVLELLSISSSCLSSNLAKNSCFANKNPYFLLHNILRRILLFGTRKKHVFYYYTPPHIQHERKIVKILKANIRFSYHLHSLHIRDDAVA